MIKHGEAASRADNNNNCSKSQLISIQYGPFYFVSHGLFRGIAQCEGCLKSTDLRSSLLYSYLPSRYLSMAGCSLNDSAERTPMECWPRIAPTWHGEYLRGMPDFGGSIGMLRMGSRFPVIGETTGNYGENYAFNRLREITHCCLHQLCIWMLAKRVGFSAYVRHSETSKYKWAVESSRVLKSCDRSGKS